MPSGSRQNISRRFSTVAILLVSAMFLVAGTGCSRDASNGEVDISQAIDNDTGADEALAGSGLVDDGEAGDQQGAAVDANAGEVDAAELAAIEAELAAIEAELGSLSMPSDDDFSSAESALY